MPIFKLNLEDFFGRLADAQSTMRHRIFLKRPVPSSAVEKLMHVDHRAWSEHYPDPPMYENLAFYRVEQSCTINHDTFYEEVLGVFHDSLIEDKEDRARRWEAAFSQFYAILDQELIRTAQMSDESFRVCLRLKIEEIFEEEPLFLEFSLPKAEAWVLKEAVFNFLTSLQAGALYPINKESSLREGCAAIMYEADFVLTALIASYTVPAYIVDADGYREIASKAGQIGGSVKCSFFYPMSSCMFRLVRNPGDLDPASLIDAAIKSQIPAREKENVGLEGNKSALFQSVQQVGEKRKLSTQKSEKGAKRFGKIGGRGALIHLLN